MRCNGWIRVIPQRLGIDIHTGVFIRKLLDGGHDINAHIAGKFIGIGKRKRTLIHLIAHTRNFALLLRGIIGKLIAFDQCRKGLFGAGRIFQLELFPEVFQRGILHIIGRISVWRFLRQGEPVIIGGLILLHQPDEAENNIVLLFLWHQRPGKLDAITGCVGHKAPAVAIVDTAAGSGNGLGRIDFFFRLLFIIITVDQLKAHQRKNIAHKHQRHNGDHQNITKFAVFQAHARSSSSFWNFRSKWFRIP